MKRLVFPALRLVRILTILLAALCITAVLSFATALSIVYAHFSGSGTLPADCAVVFGAAVYGNSFAGPAIVRRVASAADLYRRGLVSTLILSGGRGTGNSQSEAQVMKTEAVAQGVRSEDIILEQNSRSTWDNLLLSRPLTSPCTSVIGISDRYHLARIELLASRQGWDDLKTIPVAIRAENDREKRSIFREAIAYVYYALHLDVLFPKPRDS